MSAEPIIGHKPKWRRRILRLLLWLVGVVAVVLALLVYLLYAPAPPEPGLSGRAHRGMIRVGQLERTYLLYAPARPTAPAPLLVVFHGWMGSPGKIRVETGYEFDRLADRHGFVVAYPQGHEGGWNDCRSASNSAARRLGIDDIGFVEALIARLARERGTDPARVFVVGLSNGGQFVFRLALERPELIAGAAAFAAGLPAPENLDCAARGTPPPMMIVNGTRDPINPHRGGNASIFGFVQLGPVRSAIDSAGYFAGRRDAAGPTTTTIRPREPDGTFVRRSAWRGATGDEVILLSVNGGGHVVPQSAYRPPRLLGRVSSAINGPSEAWEFFRRRPSTEGRPPAVAHERVDAVS